MHRLSFLALLAFLITSRTVCAQVPLGGEAAVFTYTPSAILADPVRPRVYVTDTASNSVVVIDTTTLTVSATVPTGSNPVSMAISPDGNTLYVANGGSTLSAIALLDLNALTVRGTFSLVNAPVAIAAGLGGRLYVSASPDGFSTAIYQLDSATGAVQTTFNSGYYGNDILTISPDGKTLFVANNSEEPDNLKSFDVSTATPAALQVNSGLSTFPRVLVVSHNGNYLCLATENTYLYSTSNITAYYGSFSGTEGSGGGPLAFSPDDSLVYQANGGELDVFSTTTFTEVNHALLPGASTDGGYPGEVNQVVIDNTGSYLFIGTTTDNGTATTGQLAVITTGAGTLTPPSIVPTITSSLSVEAAEGTAFTYQITAANAPSSFNATGLPAGLSVNTATGVISGKTTGEGYFEIAISAANASGAATATLELDVVYDLPSYPPVITTSSLPAGVIGQSYSVQIAASNAPYSYSATGLPGGLSIDPNYGLISGVPTTAGSYTVTVQAKNDYGTGTATLALTTTLAVPVVTSATAAAGAVGVSFTYQIAATNAPTDYTASGLPAGLSVSATTGLISGKPTVGGTFSVTLSASNSMGTGTSTLALTVAGESVPVVTSVLTVNAQQGQAFSYQIAASNAPTSYSASGLPVGLSLDTASGLISGTPTQAGTASVSLGAANSGGTGTATLALNVISAVPVVAVVATTPSVTVGSGGIGEFILSMSAAQANDIVVSFTIKGTAVNGTDYVLLKTTKKIKAGSTSKPIKVVPQGDLGGASKKTVVLTLEASGDYILNATDKAKVRILGE